MFGKDAWDGLRGYKRVLRALSGALLSAAILATGVAAEAGEGYRLISLGGNHVKWGAPVLGAGATVRYAFVSRPLSQPDARNCASMVSLDTLLERSEIPNEVFRSEVAAAFEMWEVASGISFKFSENPEQADILIGAQAVPEGFAYANVSYRNDGPPGLKTIDKSLICLNPDRRWKVGFDGNMLVYDLRYTIAHEIGHAIGLDHPSPSGALMGFRYREQHETLQAGDLAGVRMLYGARQMPVSVAGAAERTAPASAEAAALPPATPTARY